MRDYPHIYSQRDPQWAGNQLGTATGATIGAYGCILTCHAMKAGYYGHQITPGALNDIYKQRNLYVSGDLLSDADFTAVYADTQLTDTKYYTNVPADLTYLVQLAKDPSTTVTIEVDFDHNPNDGIQTHFVELHDFDGTTLTIFDPWYGTLDNFTTHYGTSLGQTILKFAVYKGNPSAAPVPVDPATFQKLVTNSTSYDAVCDELTLPHNTSGDKVVGGIKQLKLDLSTANTTVTNLNKQIPELEGQLKSAQNEADSLAQQLQAAQSAASHPDSGQNYMDLYNQAEHDLVITRQRLSQLQTTYNQSMGQYKNTSYLLVDKWFLLRVVTARIFGLAIPNGAGN